MEIRKLFRVEAAQHVVRNATSFRCSHSVHNHGVQVELFFKADHLDNAQMVCDFGILKNIVGKFIDSFDHCMAFWCKDDPEYIRDMQKWNDRWIILPVNPTAEALSIYLCATVNYLLSKIKFANGESNVYCSKVIYHETSTGYAEALKDDIDMLPDALGVTEFSDGVIVDWPKELVDIMLGNKSFIKNKAPELQVKL